MKFLPLLITLFCLSPLTLKCETTRGAPIQILLEKDTHGNSIPMLIDANGEKIRLTLGTFVNATAESWMNVKEGSTVKIDPNTLVFVRLDKMDDGHLKAILYDNKGREEPLNLGNLLSAAASGYPNCVSKKDIEDQTVHLKIAFAQDSKNNLQAYLDSPKAKEEFNLGVLLREITLFLNQCPN